MRTAGPATGTALTSLKVFGESAEMLLPGLHFLHRDDPTDPLIAGQWGEAIPDLDQLSRTQDCQQVFWHLMHDTLSDFQRI